MPVLREEELDKDLQFRVVDDEKLRTSVMLMADKYSKKARDIILKTYTDPEILSIYQAIRASGIYDNGGKSKVSRKIVEYPNAYVADYVETVLNSLYGEGWKYDVQAYRKAMNHELVRPWVVVSKI